MTDRLKGCTVAFDRDIRDDDVEFILNAIRMVKGVRRVDPVLATVDDYIVRMKLESEFQEFLINALDAFRNRGKT